MSLESSISKCKILLLAANPINADSLRLSDEFNKIKKIIKASKYRDSFEIISEGAVTANDLRTYLLNHKPNIVHFSGHGSSKGIYVENISGTQHLIPIKALQDLLGLFSDSIDCVVLNSCYSKKQAKAISANIEYVIGTETINSNGNELTISDEDAINFSVGFYDALSSGNSISKAFEVGCVSIHLNTKNNRTQNEVATPILFEKNKNNQCEKKLFISYRHIKPDIQITDSLDHYFSRMGADVFIDRHIKVGMDWAAEVSYQIQQCDYFILLISANSIRSDMVRQEIDEARKYNKIILPIRVNYNQELPYDLDLLLGKIQYVSWESHNDTSYIQDQLWKRIQNKEALSENSRTLAPITVDKEGAPLPVADIYAETGAIKSNSPFYVKRETDNQALRNICRVGSTTIIKAPRQMGKSSLLACIHSEANTQGQKVCHIDLQFLDKKILASLLTLTQYISRKIARTMKSKERIEKDDFLGPKESLTAYIEDIVLMEVDNPFVLILDEVDILFQYNYRDDFFSLIRAWHNLRAYESLWENFNIVIAHSTEPHLLIQDINQSPFNVGERIDLENFSLAQIDWLNERYGKAVEVDRDLSKLYKFTGGHPYLTRQALYTIASDNITVMTLEKIASTDNGPFGDHLRRLAWLLSENEELLEALQKIILTQQCDDENVFLRLRSSGLILGESFNNAHIRNQLYMSYFSKKLLFSNN